MHSFFTDYQLPWSFPVLSCHAQREMLSSRYDSTDRHHSGSTDAWYDEKL